MKNALAAGVGASLARSGLAVNPSSGALFPSAIPPLQWRQFHARGFPDLACGLIYDQQHVPRQGMALGSIDTGYVSLEVDGTLGYCTLFNSIVPQRGPLNFPIFGLSVADQRWLLASPRHSRGTYMFSGIQTPANIRYWGHFPVADLEFEMPGSPLQVGLRAWTPFLPGDVASSNTPGAVFEIHLRNHTHAAQRGSLGFSFPGPTQAEAQISVGSPRIKTTAWQNDPYVEWIAVSKHNTHSLRRKIQGKFSGLTVSSEKVSKIGYAIGVIGDNGIQVGGALDSGSAWAQFPARLPTPSDTDFGGSVSVPYALRPGEHQVLRFVLAWYAPDWIGEGSHTFTHMYTTRYQDALAVAEFLAENHTSLLSRVLAWQQVIFAERDFPVWLREALVNILYLIPVNSLWAVARPPIGPWCRPEDGLFGMIDGIIEDPAVEPMPDSFYANAPLAYFFPELALSTMRGYKAYQFYNGAAPWIFGGVVGYAKGGYRATAGTEMAMPTPGYQATTTGPCYVDMVDRYWQRTGNDAVLKEFYGSVKRNTIYTMGLRRGDGDADIISVPTGDVDPNNPEGQPGYHLEWFESILWFGMTPHVGGIHLANLEMTARMAEQAGDTAFARQCRNWIARGSRVMEKKLWTGKYYLAYDEPKTGRRSDDIFAYQLDGEWMVRFHGLSPVFPPSRVRITLETIRRTCVAATRYGAVNMTHADGHLAEGVGYGPNTFFVPELYMLAMNYMYSGERSFGLELVRRCIQGVTIKSGSEWNQPNIIRGDNGEPVFGSHYDQNMMLWAIPAALAGQDIKGICGPNGIVTRICKAAAHA